MKSVFVHSRLLHTAAIFLFIRFYAFAQPLAGVKFVYTDTVVGEYQQTIPLIIERDLSFADSVEYDILFIPDSSNATIGFDFMLQDQYRKAYHGVSYDTLYNLNVLNDWRVEDTEMVYILIRPTDFINGYTDTVFRLYILPSDTLTCSFNGAAFSYVEDTELVQVKVVLTDTSSDSTVVRVSLDVGNALSGTDYNFTNNQTLVWPPGNNDTLFVWVEIIDDTIHEVNEQINFNLTKLKGSARMDVVAYTIFIVDNDSADTHIAAFPHWNGSAYPNPVANTLHLQSESPLGVVTIFNLLSQPLWQQRFDNETATTIAFSDFPAGQYFLQIQDESGSRYLKILKSETP